MSEHESDPLKYIKNLSQLEMDSVQFAQDCLEEFEFKLDWLTSADTDLITLFKADFKPHSSSESWGHNEYILEFIGGKGSNARVRAGVLTYGFYMIFKDSLKVPQNPPKVESSVIFPSPLTDGLANFISQNPRLKTNVNSAIYDISDKKGEIELITAHRYFHPITNHPIADIWEAERFLDLGDEVEVSSAEQDISRYNSKDLIRHPAYYVRS